MTNKKSWTPVIIMSFVTLAVFAVIALPAAEWFSLCKSMDFERRDFRGVKHNGHDFMEINVYNPLTVKCYRFGPSGENLCFPVNRDGMISDRDFVIPKPAGIERIALLGDSFAAGFGLDAGDSLWHRLDVQLDMRAGGHCEVLNFSFPGSNTVAQVGNFLHKRRGPKYEPDVIVVRYQCNDILPFSERYYTYRIYDLVDKWFFFLPVDKKNKLLGILIARMRSKFTEYYESDSGAVIESQMKRPMRKLQEYAGKKDVEVVLISDFCEVESEYNKEYFSEVYVELERVAHELGWHYFDLCDTGINFTAPDMDIPGDSHPSAKCNALLAAEIADFIIEKDLITQ